MVNVSLALHRILHSKNANKNLESLSKTHRSYFWPPVQRRFCNTKHQIRTEWNTTHHISENFHILAVEGQETGRNRDFRDRLKDVAWLERPQRQRKNMAMALPVRFRVFVHHFMGGSISLLSNRRNRITNFLHQSPPNTASTEGKSRNNYSEIRRN